MGRFPFKEYSVERRTQNTSGGKQKMRGKEKHSAFILFILIAFIFLSFIEN
jgi:hypothetical protein